MLKRYGWFSCMLAMLVGGTLHAATVQEVGSNRVGVQAESPDSLTGTRFIIVDTTSTFTSAYGTTILPATTNALGEAALLHNFSGSGGVARYDFVFDTPGTYYAYMRFSFFEDNANTGNYGNEDSIFVSTDWGDVPAGDNLHTMDFSTSGYPSGHSAWEGTYRWNQVYVRNSSGAFRSTKVALTVDPGDLGNTLSFYMTPRESGISIDYLLFSTDDNLTNAQLNLLVPEPATFSVMGLGMFALAMRRRRA
ncbi:PEP-CTERM sorting domain-containing protein [Planctomycetales bacterium ZRK34]|nr:PEP-CTERM sorting domain-containing protein [Planctomycetales bacterium ZRK34]